MKKEFWKDFNFTTGSLLGRDELKKIFGGVTSDDSADKPCIPPKGLCGGEPAWQCCSHICIRYTDRPQVCM